MASPVRWSHDQQNGYPYQIWPMRWSHDQQGMTQCYQAFLVFFACMSLPLPVCFWLQSSLCNRNHPTTSHNFLHWQICWNTLSFLKCYLDLHWSLGKWPADQHLRPQLLNHRKTQEKAQPQKRIHPSCNVPLKSAGCPVFCSHAKKKTTTGLSDQELWDKPVIILVDILETSLCPTVI